MTLLPLRIQPGVDLRSALHAVLPEHGVQAGYVIQGMGSLTVARIRLAGASILTELRGDFELLTLAGSLSPDGVHLHLCVSDAAGRVTGGHMGEGCIVRTTAEVLVALLDDYRFTHTLDAATGYPELAVSPAASRA